MRSHSRVLFAGWFFSAFGLYGLGTDRYDFRARGCDGRKRRRDSQG